MTDDRSARGDGARTPFVTPAPLTIGADEPNGALNSSTIEVIARSGVKAASMTRIARNASVSTGAIYPKFPVLDTLVETSFDVAMKSVVQQNFESLPAAGYASKDFGHLVASGLDPVRTIWRDFRLEFSVAARHRPRLAAQIGATLEDARRDMTERLKDFPFVTFVAGPLGNLTHTLGVGMSILQNCGVPVAGIDHRRVSSELSRAFAEAFASRLSSP